jgi:ribosome-binding protein aMBF1 (putative translation factor)
MSDETCKLCGKDINHYEGMVWYSGDIGIKLCRSCHLKWLKSKECKSLENKYKKAKPTTKEWFEKHFHLQNAFNKWFKKPSPPAGDMK